MAPTHTDRGHEYWPDVKARSQEERIARLADRLRECRHALATYQGLWAHDGDPAHAFQLEDGGLIRRIDADLG